MSVMSLVSSVTLPRTQRPAPGSLTLPLRPFSFYFSSSSGCLVVRGGCHTPGGGCPLNFPPEYHERYFSLPLQPRPQPRPHLLPKEVQKVSQLPPVLNRSPLIQLHKASQLKKIRHSIFMFLNCLKYFLTYRMSISLQTGIQDSAICLQSLPPLWPLLHPPRFPSSRSSQTHQPVSCPMPFSLPAKGGFRRLQWIFKFHLKHHCLLEPLTMASLAYFQDTIYCPKLKLLVHLSILKPLRGRPALIHTVSL